MQDWNKLSEMFSNMGNMKKEMEEVHKRIASLRVSADAGAGMVTVTASGDGHITDVKVNKALFEADENKMLEDLILSATNSALEKAKQSMEYELKNAMGGMDLSQLQKFFGGGNV